jgi:hypothetical protein
LRPFFRLLRVSERVSPIVPALLIILCFGLLLFLEFSSAMDAISEFTPVYPNDSVIVTILRQLARPFTAGYRQVPDMGLTLLFAAVIVVGGSFTALTCFVVPAILLLSIILLPFGAESALAGLLVEISVETVPAGVWRVHQFGPTDDEGQGLNLLHSSSYEDRRVLSLIARWIMQGGQTGAANKTSEHEQPHLTDPVL